MALRWYFDFVSPFAYLHWQKVKALPIAFGAVLHHLGHLGPAEIPAKRRFIYRQVLWTAAQEEVALRFPPAHPFNPLPALRLCIAAGSTCAAVDTIFDWIWQQGRAADEVTTLAELAQRLRVDDPAAAIGALEVKETLRRNTDAAIAAGVFGVPTLAINGELFWGNEAHPLMAAVLDDPALLLQPDWQDALALPVAVHRRR